ncbi:MAG TPA: AAA family ATPase, partial [Acidimicrobiia bacterium]
MPPARFVGRRTELSALTAELERARAGEVRVVLVEGPTGIGKTALVRHFLDAHGLTAVEATGDELESRLAFGVVEQLVAGVADRSALLSNLRSDRSADPLAVGAELLDLVGNLRFDDALAVVVDDAQWADAPSMQALTFALRRLQADPILGIVVARDDAALPEGMRRFVDRERGRRMPVGGLERADLVDLAAVLGIGDLPTRAADRLHDHTRGHPLHARTLMEEIPAPMLRSGNASLPAPRSYAVLVLARLAACSRDVRQLVPAAAVLGQYNPLSTVARVAGLDDPLPAVDEAARAGLLVVEASRPPALSFRHPLVRAAVYDDLGPARRAELHRRAADVVEGAAALDHRLAAAPAEDATLAAELEADGRRLARAGLAAAAGSRLVAAARVEPAAERRQSLVLDGAELFLGAGEVLDAVLLTDDVAAGAAGARRSYVLGHLAMMGGQVAEAETLLEEAWRNADDEDDRRVAALAAGLLAQLASLQDRFDDAIAWARRGLTASDDPAFTSSSLAVLVGVLAGTGRAEEALATVAGIDAHAVPLAPGDIDALQGRGCARLWTDDLPGAREDLDAVVRAGREAPATRGALIALGYLAETEYRLGSWDHSVLHADLALSLARDSDQLWLDGFVHAHAVWVLAARGDWELAGDRAAAARALGEPWALGCVGAASAHLAFCRGDAEQVVAAVQPLLAHPQRAGLDEPGVHRWREPYVDALVTLGRLDDALAVLDPFEEQATARDRRASLAAIHHARARVAAIRGDARGAHACFDVALDHARAVPAPFEHAQVQDAYGRFLRRAGERRAATEHLGAAREVYERLGARPFLERVEREL